MANRRAIVKRRKAAGNIRKITRTMQLIATARFQAAMNRALATRPYTDKLAELVADLTAAAQDFRHPLMERHDRHGKERPERSTLVVLTSNRGLCGGYNANVLRRAIEHIDQQQEAGVETRVHMVGKKGVSAFRFRRRPVAHSMPSLEDKPRYDETEPLARQLMEEFKTGEVGSVHVAYMRFYSAGRQRPEVFQLLPLSHGEAAAEAQTPAAEAPHLGYEVLPSPRDLLDRLLPATVRTRLFQSFVDAAVSEQIARMAAMKAATEAAEEMIRNLTLQYNRARQTHITMELLDIVGGANALA
jgi:F-type H+-transporting ATPase subunit gamma